MMSKETISTPHAPAAVGPYSQAVVTNGMVFTAGQLGLIPETGQMIEGDVAAQTRQVLDNLKAVLEASGSSLDSIVKTTVFLMSMDDFAAMNAVYGQYFTAPFPARSTVEVAKLPKNALVEIECIALVK
jgi:2-iminobutanoate/2-iminopropanoate deaminase